MSGKRKSLRDEIADLLGPAPTREHDPDALDLGDGALLADDGDYEETRRAPTRRAPEKAMLMRGDIDLEDAAYRGRTSSRAAVFGDADDDEDDDDDDVDLDLELGGSDDEEEDEEEDEEAGRGRRAAAAGAGPSGRAAGVAVGAKGRRGSAANGHLSSGSEGGLEDEDDDDDEGEGDEGSEGDDGEDLMLAAGDEDEDDEGATGTGTGTEDGEEEEEEDTAGATALAARAAAAARRRAAAGAGGDDELDALEAEYEALQEEDEAQLMSLRQKGERDRVKGLAVRNQQALYERALEQRILLQRCLQASNGLPRPDTHAALVATQPEVREGFADLASAARSTLTHLLELQHTLMARTPGIQLPASTAAGTSKTQNDGKRKRDQDDDDDDNGDDDQDAEGGGAAALDSLWLRLSSQHEALAPYRDTALDSWHRRTVLSSGSGALRNAGLRALNQSISSQVAALMRDPAKFIKRTRLTLSACPRVLCEPARESAAAATTADPHAAADVEAETAALEGGSSRRGVSASEARDVLEEERDAETYDDAEFYQQLLKEFLDKGMQGAAAGAPKAAKKRKLVDRRASKGRKLRYHVQEKLVAFMAPVESELPPFAAQLFSNLFGHAGH